MNERNEIGGDLQDEYTAIQDAEAHEGAPAVELCEADLEDWYQSWLSKQEDPAGIDPEWNASR